MDRDTRILALDPEYSGVSFLRNTGAFIIASHSRRQ